MKALLMERDRIRISPWALRVTGGMDLTAVRRGLTDLHVLDLDLRFHAAKMADHVATAVNMECDGIAHRAFWALEGVRMRSRRRIRGFRG